jgi:outer membrane protein assembly factor BamB
MALRSTARRVLGRVLFLGMFLSPVIPAQEWPQFRGPGAKGVALSRNLPDELGPATGVVWKTALPAGHSSPIISGDRIFVTAGEGGTRTDLAPGRMIDSGGKLVTISLDRNTGKILWRREAPRPRIEKYQPANTPASPTPVTDGKSVWVFFGDFGLISYSVDGEERWRLPLGPFNNPNGHGSSPVVDGDLVFVVCDQDTDSFVLAVDKNTGAVRWRVERPEVTRSYATPGVVPLANGARELIVPGAYQLTSYDAATGKKLWWIHGLSWQPKSAPVFENGVVYAHWWESGGEAESPTETPEFGEMLVRLDTNKDRRLSHAELGAEPRLQRGMSDVDLDADGVLDERDWNYHRAKRAARNALLAVRPGGRGEVSASHVLWRIQKFLPNTPSPLLYEGLIYLIKDGGILTAVDSRDGAVVKQGRLPDAIDTYYSSPVAGDGKIYLVSKAGKATVVRAGRDWAVLATRDFEDEVHATPAIAGDSIYVRTRGALYRLKKPD